MKITEQKTETVTKEIVTDVLCNLCGESCLDKDECRNDLGVEVNIHGCYGSAFPPDMTSWKFHLCELCVAFLVSRCKLFPDVEDHMGMSGEDKFKALLTKGETADYYDWVKIRYAKAMSRVSLFSSEETVRLVSSAAKSAADELESQRKTYLKKSHAMHEALDKSSAPYACGEADGFPVYRVAALAGSTDDRLVILLRKLYKFGQDRFDGKDVDSHGEAVALDEAHGYLTANGKLPR